MKTKAYLQFKKRFAAISEIERKESKNNSIKNKLKQLTSIISLASDLGLMSKKMKKLQMTNNNWSLLKT